jgi:hypothetical protein
MMAVLPSPAWLGGSAAGCSDLPGVAAQREGGTGGHQTKWHGVCRGEGRVTLILLLLCLVGMVGDVLQIELFIFIAEMLVE